MTNCAISTVQIGGMEEDLHDRRVAENADHDEDQVHGEHAHVPAHRIDRT
jgi:hypothetical protein